MANSAVKTINVTTTRYEGDDFPEASHWDDYVLAKLAERFPGVEISVVYGPFTLVTVYGPDDVENGVLAEDIAHIVKVCMWDDFCGSDYEHYST